MEELVEGELWRLPTLFTLSLKIVDLVSQKAQKSDVKAFMT